MSESESSGPAAKCYSTRQNEGHRFVPVLFQLWCLVPLQHEKTLSDLAREADILLSLSPAGKTSSSIALTTTTHR